VLLLGLYLHLGFGKLALVLYLVVFGGALIYQNRGTNDHWQRRFQDYRVLAEALRVQIQWALSGIPQAVCDDQTKRQHVELGWIQRALVGPALWATAIVLDQKGFRRDLVTKVWIHGQHQYFERVARAQEKVSQRCHYWARKSLIAGFLLSVTLLILEVLKSTSTEGFDVVGNLVNSMERVDGALAVLITLAPAIAAFFTVLAELRASEQHVQSYALMRRIFIRAANQASRLEEIKDTSARDEAFQQLVLDVGREALVENAEWLAYARLRPIQPGF
jgi:hypothetical protein